MPEVIDKVLRAGEGRILRRFSKIADQVDSIAEDFAELSDSGLRAKTEEFKQRYADGETLDDLLPEAFAAVREASTRTLGQRHFRVQIMGGAALHNRYIAEMRTGEGKTLTSVLPAYLNALEGKGVHVVTVNDYLAKRDAEWMGRIHHFLGLEVGVILSDMTPEERRKQYDADITYGTNNEFGFDYLRDNMAWSQEELVQRGHHFAIVDEVDSILIDEARTPLIISGPAEQNSRWYEEFAKIVPRLRGIEIVESNLKTPHDKARAAEQRTKYDYEYDPKKRTVGVLEKGVEKVEDQLGIDNLYDSTNTPLVSFMQNALKAKELYKRDNEYVVMNGEVLIVDEFTGRILHGRRFNEGMHQAIEAKEGVQIKDENQTLATITLQNYFRLYEKLAGMTGTAMTEANEFQKTYELGVVPIPTNMPMIRKDESDLIYQTGQAKFEACVEDIFACHQAGQPVLVGTISVEKSEVVSKMLKRRGVPHEVLNAKNHEREAAIIAQAGRAGAVTVATNMAGRGTDIMLGGNPEFMADLELHARGLSPLETPEDYEAAWPEALDKAKRGATEEHEAVVAAGGLYVLGTERHESRRIDNQLRGRSGRQGDPGESRFYLSLEDDLMRMFNADKVAHFMEFLKTPPEVPIESKTVTRAIRSAQTQVEQQNFEIRKDVLKYDDVLNRQRKVIYGERHRVLAGEDMTEQIRDMISEVVGGYVTGATAEGFPEEWDLEKLWTAFRTLYPVSLTVDELTDEVGGEIAGLSADFLHESMINDAQAAYQHREQDLGPEVMRELERRVVLSVLDRKWREHLYEMDYLREGIGLRAMAQRDPLIEYQREGFDMFSSMMEGIKEESVGLLFNVEVEVQEPGTGQVPNGAQPEQPPTADAAAGPAQQAPAQSAGRRRRPAHAAQGQRPQPQQSQPQAQQPGGAQEQPSAVPAGLAARAGMGSGHRRQGQLQYTAPTMDGGAGGGAGVEQHTEGGGNGPGRIGRNDPCPCGSGRKYKRCHGDPRTRGDA